MKRGRKKKDCLFGQEKSGDVGSVLIGLESEVMALAGSGAVVYLCSFAC